MTSAVGAVAEEVSKIPAFFRRNFLTMISYRAAFFADWFTLISQLLVFSFVGRMVNESALPVIGGRRVGYIEFVAVGIALMSFVQVGLSRVLNGLRQEQLIGTLEYLFVTPTTPTTIQLGLVVFDLFYVPLRTFIFLALASLFFDISFTLGGLGPALVILLTFIPFIWGLGMISAAATLTFRRGAGIVGVFTAALTILSAAYIPLDVLPPWARWFAEHNPLTLALAGTREALLGGAGWSSVPPMLVVFIPLSVVSLILGVFAFRLAMHRERRNGTLAMY